MLKFVKPNTVLLLSERIIEDNQPSQKYAYFDRAFIVTNEEGYDILLKTASEIFKDESIEFFGDFVATKNIDYIVSVQWGILEAFLRACYDQIVNGVVNMPHIAYDIYMNDTYRKYFPFLNFDEKILNDMESKMHQSTYDLLSYDDLCNVDQDIALFHRRFVTAKINEQILVFFQRKHCALHLLFGGVIAAHCIYGNLNHNTSP